MVGVSIVSILIGLISDTVNEYMEGLSSGSSKVAEEGHTLVRKTSVQDFVIFVCLNLSHVLSLKIQTDFGLE
jgi:hypothetical protein